MDKTDQVGDYGSEVQEISVDICFGIVSTCMVTEVVQVTGRDH